MTSTNQDRERWLIQLAKRLEPEFQRLAGVTIPAYAVTCGFPSRGGELGKKSRTMGQCWAAGASEAKRAEIFISPVEDDRRIVTFVLVHELIHACHPAAGHKGEFMKTAKKLGHLAPFTEISDKSVDSIMAWAGPIVEAMPPYPHKRLNALAHVGAKKKQTSRMLKAECEDCGYTCRVTRKWVEAQGAPICPCNRLPMRCEGAESEEEGED